MTECTDKAEQIRAFLEAQAKRDAEKKHENRLLKKLGMNHTWKRLCEEEVKVRKPDESVESYVYTKSRCVICGETRENTYKPSMGY